MFLTWAVYAIWGHMVAVARRFLVLTVHPNATVLAIITVVAVVAITFPFLPRNTSVVVAARIATACRGCIFFPINAFIACRLSPARKCSSLHAAVK